MAVVIERKYRDLKLFLTPVIADFVRDVMAVTELATRHWQDVRDLSGATVMKKIPTRESQPQPSEQPRPRRRNVYDYDGEYEFLFAQHWTASETNRAD